MKKLAVLILLLGFIANSPVFSAVLPAITGSCCEQAKSPLDAGKQSSNTDESPVNDSGDEADDVKLPAQPVQFSPVFSPENSQPKALHQPAQFPQLHYAVNTPPPRF